MTDATAGQAERRPVSEVIGAHGLFVDPAQEAAFVHAEWRTLGARVRNIGLYGALAFLAAAFTDYTVLGPAPSFWALLGWRLVVLFWGWRLVHMGRARRPDVRSVAVSLLGFEVAIAGAFLLVVIAYRGTADYHSITALTLLFALYAYVPQLRREMLWVGPAFTLLFGLVVWLFLSFDSKYVAIALVLFAFANLAGWQVAVTQSRAARLGWLDRCQLRTEASEARKARKRAEESEDNLNRLFDATPVAMVLTRQADGMVLRVNPAALALFDPGGRTAGTAYPAAPEFYDDRAERAALLERLRGEGSVHQAAVRMRTTGGETFDALVSIQPVRYAGEDCVIAGITEISALKTLERQLRVLAYADPLTGVHNRRSFFAQARRAIDDRKPGDAGPCVVLIDLDHFKRINDAHGHPVGDEVLVEFARIAGGLMREGDVFARLGGEEFAMLLPGTSLEEAADRAECLRQRIEQHAFGTPAGPLRLTLSLGVADCRAAGDNIDVALSRADQAMYRAKQSGRNKTEVACV